VDVARGRAGAQGNSTALVGSPDTVAKALFEYYKRGATSLLIRGYDPRPDAVYYGEELIPRIRALVSDYDQREGMTEADVDGCSGDARGATDPATS
jgi:hypothetical protein